MDATRFFGRFAGLTVSRIASTVASGISLILLARWAGPDEFGSFSAAWAIIVSVSGLLGLGLPVFALRAAVLGQTKTTGYAIFLNLVSSIVGAVIGFVVATVTSSLPLWVISATAITTALEKNAEVRIGLGTEFGKSRLVNLTLFLRGILLIGIMLALNSFGISPLMSYLMSRLFVMGAAALILTKEVAGWSLVTRYPQDGSMGLLGHIAAQKGISAIKPIELNIVQAVSGSISAGYYAGVQKILQPAALLADSLRVIVLGPIARGDILRAKRATKILMFTSLACLVPLGISTFWAEQLVTVILGGGFAGASGAFAWALLSLPTPVLGHLMLTILQDKGYAAWATWSTAVSIAVNFLGAGFGAYLGGATGAMAGMAVTMWLLPLVLFIKILSIPSHPISPSVQAALVDN